MDFSQTVALPPKKDGHAKLKVAISGMISPEKTYSYYVDLVAYVARKTGFSPLIVQRGSYKEVNALVRDKIIDFAFVCSGPYVQGHQEFGMELLAVPQVNGKTVYYSYIIVGANSDIDSFTQLRGKSFAFSDPDSHTGYQVPNKLLHKMDERAETFFAQTIFTYHHDRSITNVARGFVDAAAVDSLIWEYMDATEREITCRTRIIERVGPYAIPPAAAHPDLDPVLKEKLRRCLLNMHTDPQGAAILEELHIERFVIGHDKDYASIRELYGITPR